MSTVQLPDNNHVIDMTYNLPLFYLTCSQSTTWAQANCEVLQWSKASGAFLCDLDPEFSQRPGFTLQSTRLGAVCTQEFKIAPDSTSTSQNKCRWALKCLTLRLDVELPQFYTQQSKTYYLRCTHSTSIFPPFLICISNSCRQIIDTKT